MHHSYLFGLSEVWSLKSALPLYFAIKQRRTIFGERFGVFDQLLEIIDYVWHPNDDRGQCICGMCWNRLNKFGKIEHDIKTNVESLRSERQVLIRDLRLKDKGDISSQQVCTPKFKKTPYTIVHSSVSVKSDNSHCPLDGNSSRDKIRQGGDDSKRIGHLACEDVVKDAIQKLTSLKYAQLVYQVMRMLQLTKQRID